MNARLLLNTHVRDLGAVARWENVEFPRYVAVPSVSQTGKQHSQLMLGILEDLKPLSFGYLEVLEHVCRTEPHVEAPGLSAFALRCTLAGGSVLPRDRRTLQ